jgi:hypothetical protein
VTGLLVAAVCFGWLIMTVFLARRTFRRELARNTAHYSRMYGQPLPDHSRKVALGKAYEEIVKWPATLAFAVLDWLITTEHLIGVPDSETDSWDQPLAPGTPWPKFNVIDARPERDGTDELIEKLDREINGMRVTHAPRPTEQERVDAYLALKHGPLNACPCGYRTECPIHCGSGHTTGQCPSHPEIQ